MFFVFFCLFVMSFALAINHENHDINSNNTHHGHSHHHYKYAVKLLYKSTKKWGLESQSIHHSCGNIECLFIASDSYHILQQKLEIPSKHNLSFINVGYFHLLSLYDTTRSVYPNHCALPVNLTFFGLEESHKRFNDFIEPAIPLYHGYMTYSPNASVQYHINHADLDPNNFLPMLNYTSLVKGASFIQSNCLGAHEMFHFKNRQEIVIQLRKLGFRIDGLGPCLHNTNPDGIVVAPGRDGYNLAGKRPAVARYMFHMAMENTLEDGYVTEKPFDALLSGSVPIYFGDAKTLKRLSPDPKAIIYFDDYDYDLTKLLNYLQYLMGNETAYEEHRAWRKEFNQEKNRLHHPWIHPSYHNCQICKWAIREIEHPTKQINMTCIK